MRNVTNLLNNGDFNLCVDGNQSTYFETMIQKLNEKKLVNEDFAQALRDREKQFPTGIETLTMGVAVPHVDSEFVLQNALFITAFHPAVEFNRMDEPSQQVKVSLSFLLLIKDVSAHTATLAQLTEVWKNSDLLERMAEAKSKLEVIQLLSNMEEEL